VTRPDSTHRVICPWLHATLSLAFMGTVAPSFAADTPVSPGVSAGTMLQTFLGLILILVLFLGAAWLARRLGAGNAFPGSRGPLKVVGGISLSSRERILLLEIEETWLVVGVGPGQMRTLHTLPKGSLPPPDGTDSPFGHWLQQFRKKHDNASH
jgi:flagellar protein FliO/FliZ